MKIISIALALFACAILAGALSAAVIVPKYSFIDSGKHYCNDRTLMLRIGDSLKVRGFVATLVDVQPYCQKYNKLVAIKYDRYLHTYQDPFTPGTEYEYTIEPEKCLASTYHAFVRLAAENGNEYLPYYGEINTRQGFSGTFGKSTVYVSASDMFAGRTKNSKWAQVKIRVCN
jgi:hypothetical protein